MPLFSAKLDYALRAVVDLAAQAPNEACQSREIACRQDIRGPYLDQILAVLKREGVIRSIRGAGGGYTLAKPPSRITVAEVVAAIVGDQLLLSGSVPANPSSAGATYVVRQFEEEAERSLVGFLGEVTIADLVRRKQNLDESLSIMPSI
jgi:Rrf2 family protein